MTNRERRLRLIEKFSTERIWRGQEAVLARLGMAAFTDEAVETLARKLASDYRNMQRLNRKNRAIWAAQAAE